MTALATTRDTLDLHQPVVVKADPMTMLASAFERGADIETIGKMMDYADRWEKTQARRAFDKAIAAAKGEIGPIAKNRLVDFTSQKGRTTYRHEDFAEVARTVDPVLARHGLSYRFRTTSNLNEPISVTCILAHELGYFEENTLSAGRDESGNKNSIQGIGSTITYLQRYTLKAALGLASSNDDDGHKSEEAEPGEITAEQASQLHTLLDRAGPDAKRAFCQLYRIDGVPQLPAAKFKDAKAKILQRIGAQTVQEARP